MEVIFPLKPSLKDLNISQLTNWLLRGKIIDSFGYSRMIKFILALLMLTGGIHELS
jgi:hypothetical protein